MTNYGQSYGPGILRQDPQDKWATWCQVGRARPMLRGGQLRNTMKHATRTQRGLL